MATVRLELRHCDWSETMVSISSEDGSLDMTNNAFFEDDIRMRSSYGWDVALFAVFFPTRGM